MECGAGGWFSLMMAAIYAAIMMLWQWGSTRKHAYFDSQSVPLEGFLRMSDAVCAAWPSFQGLGFRVCDMVCATWRCHEQLPKTRA